MKVLKVFLKLSVLCAIVLCACDLQPKIASIPDNIGMFIEDRYPALLADPDSQPEIYNSAVTDYGVYASPELYGSTNIDDYVLYASVDDYVLVPQESEAQEESEQFVQTEDKSDVESEPQIEAEEDGEQDYLIVPLYGGNTVLDEVDVIKEESKTKSDDVIVVAKGDTVYALARKNGMTVSEFAEINDLHEPYVLSIGQKLTTNRVAVAKPVPNVISTEKIQEIKTQSEKTVIAEPVKPTGTKRVDLQEITVQRGDTLYSLSRKYEIPVNDLAVMNKISSPFILSVGQKIKVPKLDNVKTVSVSEIKAEPVKVLETKITPAKKVTMTKITKDTKTSDKVEITSKNKNVSKSDGKSKTQKVAQKQNESKSVAQNKSQTQAKTKTQQTKTVQNTDKQKTSLNTKKESQKIVARSSSKFSWPIRGKILSDYGAKDNGLFNDGINISGTLGAPVKAAENGVVAYAGNEVKGMGNLIIIQHSDGWMTVYAHLDSMSVKRGARVNVGSQIGRVGKTGKVDKPQLHFEIRKGTRAYNPIQYLKK